MKENRAISVKSNWYEELIFDLKKLVFEGIVQTKHAIGKRILEDDLKFEKPDYGSKKIENLANDLNVDTRDLYRCIQFARKYPELPESVTRDRIAWRTIVNEYLPDKKRTKEEIPNLENMGMLLEEVNGLYDFLSFELEEIVMEYARKEIDQAQTIDEVFPARNRAISWIQLRGYYRTIVEDKYHKVMKGEHECWNTYIQPQLDKKHKQIKVPIFYLNSIFNGFNDCKEQLEVAINDVFSTINFGG
ncbi:MAG: hypothetical protein KAJ44_01675 [Thermoplasmatales archaeon]|nr:hypothetical protein [Thermoplasmatales archaeon]